MFARRTRRTATPASGSTRASPSATTPHRRCGPRAATTARTRTARSSCSRPSAAPASTTRSTSSWAGRSRAGPPRRSTASPRPQGHGTRRSRRPRDRLGRRAVIRPHRRVHARPRPGRRQPRQGQAQPRQRPVRQKGSRPRREGTRLRHLHRTRPRRTLPAQTASPGGRLGEVLIDNAGKETWVPIRIDKLTRTGKPGAHRWYQEPTIACPTNDEHTPACLLNRCLGDHDGCTPGGHPYRLPLVQTRPTPTPTSDGPSTPACSPGHQGIRPDLRPQTPRPSPTTPSAGSDTPGSASPPTATTSRACWRTARADGTTSGSTHTTRPPPDQDDPASTTARRVTTTPDHPESGSSGGLAKCCPDPPGTGRAPGILTTGESEQQQLFITPVNRPVRRATWTRAFRAASCLYDRARPRILYRTSSRSRWRSIAPNTPAGPRTASLQVAVVENPRRRLWEFYGAFLAPAFIRGGDRGRRSARRSRLMPGGVRWGACRGRGSDQPAV